VKLFGEHYGSRLGILKGKMGRFSGAQNLPEEESVGTIEKVNTQFETIWMT
jgi:hypothetical protein